MRIQFARCRRVFVASTLVVASTSALVVAQADNFSPETRYCDGAAFAGTGEGAASQLSIHSNLFAPEFASKCPIEGGLINYLGTSAPAGVRGLTNRFIPFAGTDVALTSAEKALMEGNFNRPSPVHQIPIFVDGYAIAYNLPCVGPSVNLSSKALALVYSGVITKWNHELIVADNRWLATCSSSIRLTKRADSSGATDTFQDYLAKRNPEWLPYSREALSAWPTLNFACSGFGDEGMVSCISSRPGAIGYVKMSVAAANGLPVANVQNSTLSFVGPSAAGCSAAASAAIIPPGASISMAPPQVGAIVGPAPPQWPATLGDWSVATMTDAPDDVLGGKSYPICSFGYAIMFQSWFNAYAGTLNGKIARSMIDYFTVALSDSTQVRLTEFGLAPLPPRIRGIGRDGLNSISFRNFTPLGF
ncbi:MAG: substrate-binding domain-containing protein [Actinomycetota bacterium]